MTWNPANPTLGTGAIDEAAAGLAPPDAPPEVVEFPRWPREHRPDPAQRRLWKYDAPYRITYTYKGTRYRLTGPAGFVYNGASVPRPAWSILAEDMLHKLGGPHDLPYRRGGWMLPGEWQYWDGGVWRDVPRQMPRKHADWLLRHGARRDPAGPGRFRAWAAYRIVRLAKSAWGPKPPPSYEEAP